MEYMPLEPDHLSPTEQHWLRLTMGDAAELALVPDVLQALPSRLSVSGSGTFKLHHSFQNPDTDDDMYVGHFLPEDNMREPHDMTVTVRPPTRMGRFGAALLSLAGKQARNVWVGVEITPPVE